MPPRHDLKIGNWFHDEIKPEVKEKPVKATIGWTDEQGTQFGRNEPMGVPLEDDNATKK